MEHKDLVKLVDLLENFLFEVRDTDKDVVCTTLGIAREFVEGTYYEEDEQ